MHSKGGFPGGSSSASNFSRKCTRVASVLLAGSLQTINTLSAASTRPARLFIDIPEFKPPPMCLAAWVAAQQAWAQLAVEAPSTHSSSGVKVHILGITHGQSVNCKLISGVMRELKPDVVAIEGFDDYKGMFIGENSMGDELDTQLDTVAAASWRDHGMWTSLMKCEKVLSLDQLCSWHQTLDALHEKNGLIAATEERFLPSSEHVAACRAAQSRNLKVFFVDCDLHSELGEDMQRGVRAISSWNMQTWSTGVSIKDSDVEKAGVCPEVVSELKDWVSAHPSGPCKLQLFSFVHRSASPSTPELNHLFVRMECVSRLCGLELSSGLTIEEKENVQQCLIGRRDQHMHNKLVELAHSFPRQKGSVWRLHRAPPRKVLFICGQGHVAGIQKLFKDNK